VRAAAIIDLDRFKRYNDRYGHLAGDEVLRRTADVLRALGGNDVYRFGGEEFLLVASFPTADAVGPAMDAIRSAVEDLGVAHADNFPWGCVTISLGVDVRETQVPIHLETCIRDADAALYRAKAEGRNRAIVVRPDDADEIWAGHTLVQQASA